MDARGARAVEAGAGADRLAESAITRGGGAFAARGWKEGSKIVIEERWANGQIDRLQPLAEELAAIKPAVIVAFPTRPAVAAAKAAPKTPIVMGTGADPVASGLVASLARPGGMITGLSNVVADLTEKHVELLLSIVPKLRRVGFLGDSNVAPGAGIMEAARRSVARSSIEGRFVEAAIPDEIDPAILRLAKEGSQALVVLASPLLVSERRRIVKLAAAHRWPVIAWSSEWAEAGALLSYGGNTSANFRRAAYYVDRILKGTKPGDLPIEQPTIFELVINLKTANALGIAIPQSMLLRADRLIE